METVLTDEVSSWLECEDLRLQAEGGQKLIFLQLYHTFLMTNDFNVAQTALFQALHLAETTFEISWELFLRHLLILFWIDRDLVHLAHSEAFSLQALIVDEYLRDSPHVVSAIQDLVSCYLLLDPVGYYEAIVASADMILMRVPAHHLQALLACSQLMVAAASTGKAREVERWLAVLRSSEDANRFLPDCALAHERLERWSEAKYYYQEAIKHDQSPEQLTRSGITALLGQARACCALGEIAEAERILLHTFSRLYWYQSPSLLPRLFEVLGYKFLAEQKVSQAVVYFTQAARLYLEYHLYWKAVLCGLQAADIARAAQLPEALQALSFATQAAQQLPPGAQHIRRRLLTFSRYVSDCDADPMLGMQSVTQEMLADRDLAVLRTSLRVAIATQEKELGSLLLFLLSRVSHKQKRLLAIAISHLIVHIALEETRRYRNTPIEYSLRMLTNLRVKSNQVIFDKIMQNLVSSPPPMWLCQLEPNTSAEWWRNIVLKYHQIVLSRRYAVPPKEVKEVKKELKRT